jgi:hypothetical protein
MQETFSVLKERDLCGVLQFDAIEMADFCVVMRSPELNMSDVKGFQIVS